MAKNKLQKIGRLMVPDGKYIDKSGNEKTSWHEIGIVLATPHHSNICIKLHSNGYGEGQFASVFYDENAKPNFADRVDVTKPNDEINPDEEWF